MTDNGVVQYKQDYVNGLEYRTTTTVTLSLESIFHPEGRVFNTNTGTTSADALRYEYAIKDHLGNTRLTFTDKNGDGTIQETNTAASEVLQENHYYPFGMGMAGAWMDDAGVRDNAYVYNGKELNGDFGLGLYDYGARWYDASIGRWNGVDLLSFAFSNSSPYQYASNNPINFIDKNGLFTSSNPAMQDMINANRDEQEEGIKKGKKKIKVNGQPCQLLILLMKQI